MLIGESDNKHQRHDERGYFCWPSVRGLAERLGSKRELVRRELRQLESAGVIRVEWSKGGRPGGRYAAHKIYLAGPDGMPFVGAPNGTPSDASPSTDVTDCPSVSDHARADSSGAEGAPNGTTRGPQTGGDRGPQTGGAEGAPNGTTIPLSEIPLSDRTNEGAKRERELAPSCAQPALPLRPPANQTRATRPKRQVVPEAHWVIPADWKASQSQRDRIKQEGIRQGIFDAEVDHWRSARFSSAIVDVGGFLLSRGQILKMQRRQVDEVRADRKRGIAWRDTRDEGLIPFERALEPPGSACG